MAAKPRAPLGLKGVKVHKGKGGREQMLPGRHALDTLTKGDPFQRTIGNYAKLTPIGAGAPGKFADIQAMGEKGIDLKD